jgi:hypothetical protein
MKEQHSAYKPSISVKPDRSVLIAVSEERKKLRDTQKRLNAFVWSSEIAHEFSWSRCKEMFGSSNEKLSEVLPDLETVAMTKTNRAFQRYNKSCKTFLEELKSNRPYIHRATIVYWHSAFEEFLAKRVAPLLDWYQIEGGQKTDRVKPWGPYLHSLSSACKLTTSNAFGLKIETVLQTDILRSIRNRIVHGDYIPYRYNDKASRQIADQAKKWRLHSFHGAPVNASARDVTIRNAMRLVVGTAEKNMKSFHHIPDFPVEYFYLLFMFATYDRLAFEIEEAMPESVELRHQRITWRDEREVRPRELIVKSPIHKRSFIT